MERFHVRSSADKGLPSELPSKTLSILLSGLCSGISDHDTGSWESLRRLTHFRWPVVADGVILKSLNALCIALEKSNTPVAPFAISGAITRVAEMKGAERYVTWLLDIIQRATNIAGSAFHVRDIKKSTITKVANIAVESSKLPGFVVWFHTLDTSLRPRRDRPVEVPKLNINAARLIELTQSQNPGIARGAILVFANTFTGAYEEASNILKRAPVGELETDDCWAELIEGTVRAAEDPGAIDFLEKVLSAGSGYVRAVKHAAFSKYEGVARNSTIDIVQQEAQLGLPLQDVLKLSTKTAKTSK